MIVRKIDNKYYVNSQKTTFKSRPTNILTLDTLSNEVPKVAFSWSGGKDSTIALFKILKSGKFNVVSLFTTVSDKFKRVSLSGIREELVGDQAKSIGIPLKKIIIREGTEQEYVSVMDKTFQDYKKAGIDVIAYGDITKLERFNDPYCLSTMRAEQLEKLKMKALFPLVMDTRQTLLDFVNNGFKSIITCINFKKLDESFLGCVIDREFISKLPQYVDPAGEHGEFHSFAFEGPLFETPIGYETGQKKYGNENIFLDLISK